MSQKSINWQRYGWIGVAIASGWIGWVAFAPQTPAQLSSGTVPGADSSEASSPETAQAEGAAMARQAHPTNVPGDPVDVDVDLGNGIIVDADTVRKLREFAAKPAKHVPLDEAQASTQRSVMRAWTSRVMDLSKAKKRESSRFARTSYMQESKMNTPLYLDDRVRPDGTFTGRGEQQSEATDASIKTIYRESTDGDVFKFQKMKENGRPQGEGLEKSAALDKTKSFFVDNGLLKESATDAIEKAEVRSRMTGTESPAGRSATDYLEQQDVVLKRTYEGKPVVNSLATVGVLAGSGEVVGVKLANWTPVAGADQGTVVRDAATKQEAQLRVQDVENKLVHELLTESSGQIAAARVTGMQEAWLQTKKEGLVPVLVFKVELTKAADPTEPMKDTVIVNPYGSNEIIWNAGRVASNSPGASPAEPER